MADAAGLRNAGDLAERIARAAGLDTRLARSEVTKLALYLDASPHSPKPADEQALDAIGAKTEEDGFMPLVNAVLAGDSGRVPGELRRMREVSLNPVGVVLALERRTAQLAQLSGRLGPGRPIGPVLDAEQKTGRVFYRDKRDLEIQLKRWNAPRLERLLARVSALHRTLLANSQGAELLLAQELTEIARRAAGPR
jgi:DNA polymerase-3 subunit delta